MTAPISPKSIDKLSDAISDITYLPSPEQRRVKSAFWARFSDNPICEPDHLSLPIIQQFLSDNRLEKWWKQTGFSEWFRNREEFRERVEYLIHLALDAVEGVLSNPRELGGTKVSAAKLLMEVGRKMPSKQPLREVFLDEKISSMDRKELEEFIRTNSTQPPSISGKPEKEVQ